MARNNNNNNNNKRLSAKMGAYSITKPSEMHPRSNGRAGSKRKAEFKAKLEEHVEDVITANSLFDGTEVIDTPPPNPPTPANTRVFGNPVSPPEIIVNPFGNPHPQCVSANIFLNNARARGAIIVKSAAEAQRLRLGQPRKSCLKRPGTRSSWPCRVRFDVEDRTRGNRKRWLNDMRKQRKERRKIGDLHQPDRVEWEPPHLCEDFPMTGVSEAQDAAAARLLAFEKELDGRHELAQ
ncbi:hypothetical protein QBC44DRAFT_313367 [Cladorrhinum sp. PSN332]|nr:hypothetical protein QBC44DRAFT_313367 [Cladorrhinum sp. PSN332]